MIIFNKYKIHNITIIIELTAKNELIFLEERLRTWLCWKSCDCVCGGAASSWCAVIACQTCQQCCRITCIINARKHACSCMHIHEPMRQQSGILLDTATIQTQTQTPTQTLARTHTHAHACTYTSQYVNNQGYYYIPPPYKLTHKHKHTHTLARTHTRKYACSCMHIHEPMRHHTNSHTNTNTNTNTNTRTHTHACSIQTCPRSCAEADTADAAAAPMEGAERHSLTHSH